MDVPRKNRWKVTASSGDPRLAIDDNYATTWILKPSKKPWLEIDLGEVTTLGGLEVYWGKQAAGVYGFESSLDGKTWAHLCRTRHGEGGQDVFAFPPAAARFVRWTWNRSGDRRLSKLIFTVPPTQRQCWRKVALRRSAMLRSSSAPVRA